jgi:hypothetical protein
VPNLDGGIEPLENPDPTGAGHFQLGGNFFAPRSYRPGMKGTTAIPITAMPWSDMLRSCSTVI